jgi:hypothetical protein
LPYLTAWASFVYVIGAVLAGIYQTNRGKPPKLVWTVRDNQQRIQTCIPVPVMCVLHCVGGMAQPRLDAAFAKLET